MWDESHSLKEVVMILKADVLKNTIVQSKHRNPIEWGITVPLIDIQSMSSNLTKIYLTLLKYDNPR